MNFRQIRSDRTTLLMNLCTALFIAYIVFLTGVERTESKVRKNSDKIQTIRNFLYLMRVTFFEKSVNVPRYLESVNHWRLSSNLTIILNYTELTIYHFNLVIHNE